MARTGKTAETVAAPQAGELDMLLRYKAWANELTYATVLGLPEAEQFKTRPTRWESIAYTLSHVFVVDDIFRHHLSGTRHSYSFRNIDERLPVTELHERQRSIDLWFVDFARDLDHGELGKRVDFEFVGGGMGSMTRGQILLHLVNHATYHRGLVSDMLYQVPVEMPANDLTVFLRDHEGRP